jgi:hypothetical protein
VAGVRTTRGLRGAGTVTTRGTSGGGVNSQGVVGSGFVRQTVAAPGPDTIVVAGGLRWVQRAHVRRLGEAHQVS